jgi:hypothetical protein
MGRHDTGGTSAAKTGRLRKAQVSPISRKKHLAALILHLPMLARLAGNDPMQSQP